MAERWVVNSSPMIGLGRLGYAGWFAELASRAVIPEAVAKEILAGPVDAAYQFVNDGGIEIVTTPAPPTAVASWDLGAGEEAVLALACSEPGWTAIIDDAQARRCARAMGVAMKGTLAVVILAKHAGLVDSAAKVVQELRQIGFRMDDGLIRQALGENAGEEWPE